jgi:hypothetical protein
MVARPASSVLKAWGGKGGCRNLRITQTGTGHDGLAELEVRRKEKGSSRSGDGDEARLIVPCPPHLPLPPLPYATISTTASTYITGTRTSLVAHSASIILTTSTQHTTHSNSSLPLHFLSSAPLDSSPSICLTEESLLFEYSPNT